MARTTREEVLITLQNGWGTYVERFQRLSPDEQGAFLDQQGYARLADLLGHVASWWQDGIRVVGKLREDSDLPPVEYDVDLFNAQAVERFALLTESEVIQVFETTRAQMRKLAESLPEEAYTEGRIANRMHVEVIGHYEEHPLP